MHPTTGPSGTFWLRSFRAPRGGTLQSTRLLSSLPLLFLRLRRLLDGIGQGEELLPNAVELEAQIRRHTVLFEARHSSDQVVEELAECVTGGDGRCDEGVVHLGLAGRIEDGGLASFDDVSDQVAGGHDSPSLLTCTSTLIGSR